MGFGLLEAPTRRYTKPKPHLRREEQVEHTGGKEKKLDALGYRSASMVSDENKGFGCMFDHDDDDEDDCSPMGRINIYEIR